MQEILMHEYTLQSSKISITCWTPVVSPANHVNIIVKERAERLRCDNRVHGVVMSRISLLWAREIGECHTTVFRTADESQRVYEYVYRYRIQFTDFYKNHVTCNIMLEFWNQISMHIFKRLSVMMYHSLHITLYWIMYVFRYLQIKSNWKTHLLLKV